jgi:hypothetical protein
MPKIQISIVPREAGLRNEIVHVDALPQRGDFISLRNGRYAEVQYIVHSIPQNGHEVTAEVHLMNSREALP